MSDTAGVGPEGSTDSLASRRALLRFGAAACGNAAFAAAFASLFSRNASAVSSASSAVGPYGPLHLTPESRTGLRLLELPKGFEYVAFTFLGDKLSSGATMPARPDGMACFPARGDVVRLVLNHEVASFGSSFAAAQSTYDSAAEGGVTVLEIDLRARELLNSRALLGGTVRNCAGGTTPWGTWLTCEETLVGPTNSAATKRHGYVFEVPPTGGANAVPLTALGRFNHEAASVDPVTGIVYLTEDSTPGGFYRLRPHVIGQLAFGGVLEMLAVVGVPNKDLRTGLNVGDTFDVQWVAIDQPDPDLESGALPTAWQGVGKGAAIFTRLEGIWAGNDRMYFASTSGGNAGKGQIFEFRPATQRLRLNFESPSESVMANPDNITVSPRGGLLVCEDPSATTRMHGILPDGRVFPFVRSAIVLAGQVNGLVGDFSKSEFCGACFDPSGRWLFFNAQVPGITFGVTGPWGSAGL